MYHYVSDMCNTAYLYEWYSYVCSNFETQAVFQIGMQDGSRWINKIPLGFTASAPIDQSLVCGDIPPWPKLGRLRNVLKIAKLTSPIAWQGAVKSDWAVQYWSDTCFHTLLSLEESAFLSRSGVSPVPTPLSSKGGIKGSVDPPESDWHQVYPGVK